MSMRIYLDAQKLQEEESLLQEEGHTYSKNEPEKVRTGRIAEGKLCPNDWQHLYVFGLQLHYDPNEGQPYVEMPGFRSFPYPIPNSHLVIQKKKLVTKVVLVDSWTGNQPAVFIDGLEKTLAGEGTELHDVYATLTRRKGEVHVEIHSISTTCIDIVLMVYEMIRRCSGAPFGSLGAGKLKKISYLDGHTPQA